MKNKTIFLFFALLIIVSTCAHQQKSINDRCEQIEKQRLQSLDEIQRSVLKVTCSAYYENYFYAIPRSDQDTSSLASHLVEKKLTTNSVAGTALIVQKNPQKMLLLSCHHIFDFEDTVKVYYTDKKGNVTDHLYSLSIKYGENIFVYHKNGSRTTGKVLANDEKNDIALFETATSANPLLERAFNKILEKKTEPVFGKEVYLIGMPKGFLFVTKGLLSPSPYKNRFLISAPFNRGFSGGVVVAFDSDGKNYSYLGMANSMPYDSQLIMTPSENLRMDKMYENFPYTDDLFVRELKMVNYGLTFAIKGNIIRKFIEAEKENLKLQGHYFRD